jgi:hypothetical protein
MTPLKLPTTRPEMGRHAAEQMLVELRVDIARPALLGRRGYYRDTMGATGANDIGIYDDAIMLVTPTAYVTFNANCDPSRVHHGVAVLKPGVWRYKLGTHGITRPAAQRYEALIQAGSVTVLREGQGEDHGWFGINIHRGGYNTTSSEGCQTIHPDQWDSFISLVKTELHRYAAVEIPYALTQR